MKDKKIEYGKLKFVLLQEIGKPYVREIGESECRKVDRELRGLLEEVCK